MWTRSMLVAVVVVATLVSVCLVRTPFDSSRDANQITAAATIAYTIVTGALVCAGFLAWQAAQRQIRQSDVTLRAAHRPLVLVQDAWITRGRTSESPQAERQLHVLVKNIGPGLALRVEIRAWLVESQIGQDSFEYRANRDRARRSVDFDAPQFVVERPGLASGEGELVPMSLAGPQTAPAGDIRRPSLLYMACYQNVFKEEFPSVPRSEWEAGSFLFPAGWESRNLPLTGA